MASRPRRSAYVPQEIEPRWQQIWAERGVMKASDSSAKPKYYDLVMYPYPSGDLTVGHARNYVMGDVLARMKRMQGFEVLHPFGWDAFGLPAENAAMKRGGGLHPRTWTLQNIAKAKRELKMMGILYDWDREVTSCEPDYYRWTQWLFLLMLERGLAYRAMAPVNWCPVDKTVLANEQVINGGCWRHPDVEVEKGDLEQGRVRREGAKGDGDRAHVDRAREDWCCHRRFRHQPGQQREDPDLGRRLRTGDVRHWRDHGRARARRTRLRVRAEIRPADSRGHLARGRAAEDAARGVPRAWCPGQQRTVRRAHFPAAQ